MLEVQCPKGGTVWLMGQDGSLVAKATACHSWKCRVCRIKKAGLIAGRLGMAIASLQQPWLVSLTYAAPGPRDEPVEKSVSAASALADYKELLKRLRRKWGKIRWWRVAEMTQRGQIHWHAVWDLVLPLGGLATCQRGDDRGKKNEKWRDKACTCAEHQIAVEWWRITGDSWVVDVEPIWGVGGVAHYLTKYLVKGYTSEVQREGLEEAGLVRRWSCSRDWPRVGEVHLRGTPNWSRRDWSRGVDAAAVDLTRKNPLGEYTGPPVVLAAIQKGKRRKASASYNETLRRGYGRG